MELLTKEIESYLRTQRNLQDAQRARLEEIYARKKTFNEIVYRVTQDAADLFPAWKRANPTKHPEVRL